MPLGRLPALIVVAAMAVAVWPGSRPALAQEPVVTPISVADGRVTVGGEFSATYGSEDPGYFNYTDYETSALRRVRARLSAAVLPWSRVSFLFDALAETGGVAEAYAYYLRLTPVPGRSVWLQFGRVPPVFGTFARRAYAQSNPLIGDPLLYQYLSSVRADAFPATVTDVLRMRGRGWRASYPAGNPTPGPGVPLIAGSDWDTGLQARIGTRPAQVAAAWTTGSLSVSSPWSRRGRGQFAVRGALNPTHGVTIGVSASRGTYVARGDLEQLPGAARDAGGQSAVGLDAEFERGYFIVRGELVAGRWTSPLTEDPSGHLSLAVTGGFIEARYRPFPGAHLAARVDGLRFGRVTVGSGSQPWEADVLRLEAGGGYLVTRHLLVKAVYQYNDRDGGRVRQSHLGALQVLAWF